QTSGLAAGVQQRSRCSARVEAQFNALGRPCPINHQGDAIMRKILIGLAAALLAGCATGYGYSEYGSYDGHGYGDYYYGDAVPYGSGYDPYYSGHGRTYGGLGYYHGSGYYGGLYGGWGYPWYGGYYPGWYGSPGYHYRPPHRSRPVEVRPPVNNPPSAFSRLRSAEEIEQLRRQPRVQRE